MRTRSLLVTLAGIAALLGSLAGAAQAATWHGVITVHAVRVTDNPGANYTKVVQNLNYVSSASGVVTASGSEITLGTAVTAACGNIEILSQHTELPPGTSDAKGTPYPAPEVDVQSYDPATGAGGFVLFPDHNTYVWGNGSRDATFCVPEYLGVPAHPETSHSDTVDLAQSMCSFQQTTGDYTHSTQLHGSLPCVDPAVTGSATFNLTTGADRDNDGFPDTCPVGSSASNCKPDTCPDDYATSDSSNGCPTGSAPLPTAPSPGGSPVPGKPGCFSYDAGNGYSYVLCQPTNTPPIDFDDLDKSLSGDPIKHEIQDAQDKVDLASEAVKQAQEGEAACVDLTGGLATGLFGDPYALLAIDWKGADCAAGILNNVSNGVQEALDPPDPRYRAVAIPATIKRPRLGQRCRGPQRAACRQLASAYAGFAQADLNVGAITTARGVTTNRFSAAVAAGDVLGAFLQRTAYRVLGGQLAAALQTRRARWLTVAGVLRKHGARLVVSAKQSARYRNHLKTGRGIPPAIITAVLRSGLMQTRGQVLEALRYTATKLGKPRRTDVVALYSRRPSTQALSAGGGRVGLFGAHALAAAFARNKTAFDALDVSMTHIVKACSRSARSRGVRALDREAQRLLSPAEAKFLTAAVAHFASVRPHC